MKRSLILVLAVGVLCAMATPAMADLRIKVGDANNNGFMEFKLQEDGNPILPGQGLGYAVNPVADAITTAHETPGPFGNLYFRSFCVEKDENIYPPNDWYDAAYNTEAVLGGNNTNNGDPLSAAAAWLYAAFSTGNLQSLAGGNFTYSGGNQGALQNAIWHLEEEISSIGTTAEALVDLAEDAVGTGDYVATTKYFDRYVRVLNLTETNGTNRQDILVISQEPPEGVVPEPATLGIWAIGLGLAGLGIRRRRRK